ncbi:MAG: NAD(P)-dependent oxidoreductase [Candidatus Micrarchaeota archaeon]|nr:NAD(P)-dependent oxidoreductase [Candidatus Micrarchaeota archaeon]
MARVFVTGGTGRLGAYVIELLLKNGYEVVALSRGKNVPGCTTIIGSATDFDYSKIKGCSHAVHLAGTTDMSLPPEKVYAANVDGTKGVVERCAQAGIPHFIFISSISVYGKKDNPDITERTALMPDTHYAKSKFQGEMVAEGYSGDVCILRPSIIYGRGFDAGFKMAYGLISSGKMPIFGSGRNHVPLVHAKDVANAILLAIATNATGVYNVNDENELTQQQLIDFVATLTGTTKKHVHIPTPASKLLLAGYNFMRMLSGKSAIPTEFIDMLATDRVVKTKKIRDELGFANSCTVEEGIREFVGYLSAQRLT